MKIPTPNLIHQLRQPIPRNWWDNKVSMSDAAKAEELMREAAAQLQWFLNYTSKKENT